MSTESGYNWRWSELDPMTRSVVAAFAWQIGDESHGDISNEGFVCAMTETFDDMTTEEVTTAVQWADPIYMQNLIVKKLSGFNSEPLMRTTQHIGQLAGGSEALLCLAEQASQQLHSRIAYDAIPALRVLSELAVNRRKFNSYKVINNGS